MKIQIQKLSEKAIVPKQMKANDAASDLHSTESHTLQPGERKLFKTWLAAAIPEGYYGRIAPRSWLAYKHGIHVLWWVVDAEYRWDIGVILINFWEEPFEIEEGMRIAQFIIQPCAYVEWEEKSELESTDRAEWGFGSTGYF